MEKIDEDMDQDLDDDTDDQQTEEQLKSLNERLNIDSEDYEAHVAKISLLKSTGELDDLRIARTNFADIFPLTPELWLDWIEDEKKLAESVEEKSKIHELFNRAVNDYLSVDLWLEYCQFSIGGIGSDEGIKLARDIFEKAIIAVGIHVSRGPLIWETYREFENALLIILQNSDKVASQKERINKLFKRQLTIPLLDMDKTYIEYKVWLENETMDATVISTYQNAVNMLKQREEFENQLMELNEKEATLSDNQKNADQRLSIYSSYLDFEFKNGNNPARIQNLYERRITDLCLHPHVWTTYIDYIDQKLKMESNSMNVCERATRNVPNSATIWIKYLRALERYNKPKELLLSVVEKSLSRNLIEGITKYREIWLTFIDYTRRSIFKDSEVTQETKNELRLLFQKVVNHLSSIGGDPEHQVSKYWANIEADRLRSMEEARKIWSGLMQELGDNADQWLEYINAEKMYGDSKHLRRLFLRALDRTKDQPEKITQAWLQFEREEGSLEQFEDCEKKVKSKMINVMSKRKEENSGNESQNKRGNKFSAVREKNAPAKDKSNKRKNQNDKFNVPGGSEPVFKKPHLSLGTENKLQNSSGDAESRKSKSGNIVPPPPGFKKVPPPPGYNSNKTNNVETSTSSVTKHQKSETTIFVSNLDFSITEQQIRDFFSISGSVDQVTLVKNYAGKSKGFAYVNFSSCSEAHHALNRDKELLCGRPAYISEHNPDKKASGTGHQFQYSTSIETNKLYVKNLPQHTTKEDLAKLFVQFGELKDVRLITYRNGHSKGIAYIDYKGDSGAAKAIVQTDGMKIGDNEISVAISNPPGRKEVQKDPERVSSLGGVSKENQTGYRGKGRSQIAFVPRSVQNKGAVIKEEKKPKPIQTGNGANSNADFRNMILNNK